jgi:hypothetical protein
MVLPQRANIDAALFALRDFEVLSAAMNVRADEIEAAYAAAKSPQQKAAAIADADELNRAIIDSRRILIPWTMGEGGMMASWEPLFRPHQHATDHSAVTAAVAALGAGDRDAAAASLEAVRSMEWGVYCSRDAYVTVLSQMVDCFMYWGDDFDQAQNYCDIQGVYLGLKDGSMSTEEAVAQLTAVLEGQLEPWYEEDVVKLEVEWRNAAAPLYEVLN